MWGNINFRYRARPSRFEVIRRSISDRLSGEVGVEAGAPVAHSWNCRPGHDLRGEPCIIRVSCQRAAGAHSKIPSDGI